MAIHSSFFHRLDALNPKKIDQKDFLISPIKWTVYHFCIPLISGENRSGFILYVENGQGLTRYGEVAPFPGRSQENEALVLKQLLSYFQEGKTEELFPSVQFGLESLFEPLVIPICVNTYAFLNGSVESILERAALIKEQGYTTAKIKIGSFSVETARSLIHNLKGRFRLRIDCNSQFSLSQAIEIFAPFDPLLFDYIEDPTFELSGLSHFTHPFALDETVSLFHQLPLPTYKNLWGFILKPTILGGEKGCRTLIEYARNNHLQNVLSPAFETGIGLIQMIKLGKKLGLLDQLIGLDTHRFLKHDLFCSPLCFNKPRIEIEQEPLLNLNLLTRLAHGKSTLSPL